MYADVGAIFMRSVHHRNIRVGDGYPRPMRFTQKVWSAAGVVFTTTTGRFSDWDALRSRANIESIYAMRIGDSTRVSLHRT